MTIKVNILGIAKNFDYVYFDVKSNAISIYDLVKLSENMYVKKIIIKNWNKNYIASNYKILKRLQKSVVLQFSILGTSADDIAVMQSFLSKEDSALNVTSLDVDRTIFVPEWVSQNGNKIIWDSNLLNKSFSFTVSKYVNRFPNSVKKVILFPNNPVSLERMDFNLLKNMNGMDLSFISSYAGLLVSKYGVDTIWPISVSSYEEINDIAPLLRQYFNSMNILSVMIVFSNNINKSSLSLEEYYAISNLERYVNVYLYGVPVDKSGTVTFDTDRFKWISDVKYVSSFKNGVDIYNKNNINFILLK